MVKRSTAFQRAAALVPRAGTGEGGPAMAELPPRQQAWVRRMVETGGTNGLACAMDVGYTGNRKTLSVTAHRLAHDMKILAALKEEADKRIRSGALIGASVLIEIAGDTMHKDRFRAATELLNRAGLQVVTEHKVTVTNSGDEKAMIERIASMASQLGLDSKKLLGGFVEAEFTEVTALPAPTADLGSTDGTEGLEDLL